MSGGDALGRRLWCGETFSQPARRRGDGVAAIQVQGMLTNKGGMNGPSDAAGFAVTILKFGDRKDDGPETQPLSRDARRRFQADIDTMGELFISRVVRYRDRSSVGIRAQQASTYLGGAAVEAGLADAVMTPAAAFATLAAKVRQEGSRPRFLGRRASR